MTANVRGISEGGEMLLCPPGATATKYYEFEVTMKRLILNGPAQNR